MALLKHKTTARENEFLRNLNLPIAGTEECDETVAMMERLMDESWEWEQKFFAMKKNRDSEKAFAKMFFDTTNKKQVARHLTHLRHRAITLHRWVSERTPFMSGNVSPTRTFNFGSLNPWEVYRNAKMVCERYGMDKMWDETTDHYSDRPQLSNLGKFTRRYEDPENRYSLIYDFKYTTQEWLENLEETIINLIRDEVRNACLLAKPTEISKWAIETPGYRRAQALCIAKDIARGYVGSSASSKGKHLTMKNMKWLAKMCGVEEWQMKVKKKANLQAFLVAEIRQIVATRRHGLYEHYGHATAERAQIDRMKCDWY
jgi:hypothetical protein